MKKTFIRISLRRRLTTFAVILVVVCGCEKEKAKIYPSTVEKDIRAHLAVGTSKADVLAFLDRRNIHHFWLTKPESLQDGRYVASDSHIEEAVIPNVRTEGWAWNSISVSVYIDFKFDNADSNLISYSVYEIHKGL